MMSNEIQFEAGEDSQANSGDVFRSGHTSGDRGIQLVTMYHDREVK